MPLTTEDLKTEIAADVVYKDRDAKTWEEAIAVKAIPRLTDDELTALIKQYTAKIDSIRQSLRTGLNMDLAPDKADGTPKTAAELAAEIANHAQNLRDKEKRLYDKLACCLKEQQLRKDIG